MRWTAFYLKKLTGIINKMAYQASSFVVRIRLMPEIKKISPIMP